MTTSAKGVTAKLRGAFSSFITEDIVNRCKSPNIRSQREPESISSSFCRSSTPSPVKPRSPISERKPKQTPLSKPNEETVMLQETIKKLTVLLNKEKKHSLKNDIKHKEAETQYKTEIIKLKKDVDLITLEVKKLRNERNQLLIDRKSMETELRSFKSSSGILKKQLESLASSFTQLFDFVLSKIYFSLSQASSSTRNSIRTLVKNLVDKIDETHRTTKVNLSEDLRKIQHWGLLEQETYITPQDDYEYVQDEEEDESTFYPPTPSSEYRSNELHPLNPLKSVVTEDDELFRATTYDKIYGTVIAGFKAEEANELDLSVGDSVEVISKHESEWWLGLCKGRVGIFPSECVRFK